MAVAFAAGLPGFAFPARAAWSCAVIDRSNPHLTINLSTRVREDRTRSPYNLYVSWVRQHGYAAEQQYVWIGLPPGAALLGNPDQIDFSVPARRWDRRGIITIRSPGAEQVSIPTGRHARWLGHRLIWVSASHGMHVAPLWQGQNWTVEVSDRRGQSLGQTDIRLPSNVAMQVLYTRLKGELERMAANPERFCEVIQPSGEEDIQIGL